MCQLNRNLLAELETRIPKDTLATWKANLSREQENSFKKINTPATNCTTTSWRKEGGNAIDKIRRKRKINQEAAQKQQESPQKEQDNREEEVANTSSKVVTEKTLIKNKAVFFGQDCELPYLHSSDAISNLYARKKEQGKEELLFNPANTIDSSYMTSLKSLHIYHTAIDSLRQLGTGWCNLKELSIVYGRLADLSGLSSFCSLQYLFLGFNMITSLSDLMFHPSIKCIDLERNRIENAEEIEYLATIDKLEWVNLNFNPVMRIKETRRIIQEKLGKMLELEEYGRLQEYELQEMVQHQYLLGFQGLETTNHLVKTCNESLINDEITLENLYESHLAVAGQEPKAPLDFVRYEVKHGSQFFEESSTSMPEGQQEIFFTPLIHFLTGRKFFTSILCKYFQNRIYLNMKKVENSQSPAHSLNTINSSQRLNKFAASTRFEKEKEDICSLEKKESMTTDLSSLEKGKRGRLSLGRTKKLLERFEKANPAPPSQLKFGNTFAPTSNTTTAAKTFSLKRSLIKKPSMADLQGQFDKKFSKTANFKVNE